MKEEIQTWVFSYEYWILQHFTEHLWVTASGSWILKHFSLVTNLLFARRIAKQLLWRLTETCSHDCYQLPGKLVCKLFYHMTFVLFYRSWLYPNGADMRHTTRSNLLNGIEIKRYSLSSLMGILILVQLLLILWQFYNLFITACSKNFLM